MRTMIRLLLFLYSSPICLGRRVAVIGGGISGSFFAKYLSEYDEGSCALTKVTLFDPFPMGESTTTTEDDWQGSRVASTILSDGSVVDMGASVFYSGFRLLVEMIKGDASLVIGEAFNTGKKATKPEGLRSGLGIYGGNGLWHLLTANSPSFINNLKLLWRYNIDFYHISSATNRVENSFSRIHKLLKSTHISTFYKSPDQMWNDVGLIKPAHVSFDVFLDSLGLSRELSWWRQYLPYQGVLRDELMTAINLCNYNQGNSQVNGLVGLGSFVSAKVDLLSIVGGNQKVIKSALKQAQENHKRICNNEKNVITHLQHRVTTVVADLNTMELFSHEQSLGEFDVVVLAAPLQQARVDFLMKSTMDSAVVLPMPFRLIDTDESESPVDGFPLMPHPLPDIATTPYIQVVTTLVSQANLNGTRFGLDIKSLPRGIYMTEAGKAAETNITSIAQITPEGVYKIFSSEKLSVSILTELFGPDHNVEFIKVWGGKHGGATPDYKDQGFTLEYLLFDGGVGLKGGILEGSALYYVNAIEGSMACMELSAIGAKSVAKLVAQRIGIVQSWEHAEDRSEEL